MESSKLAGYRIIRFSDRTRRTLQAIAGCLSPRHEDILDRWLRAQYEAWVPPGMTEEDLRELFGDVMARIFSRLGAGEIEECLAELEESGAQLAGRQFPFEALIISLHFFEESYMPEMLSACSGMERQWLVAMDEFLHAALAAMATSYFESYRRDLMDRAEVGRIVQEGLMAAIPRRSSDLEIAHIYISAREQAKLGGDFLDSFQVDGQGIGFLIGDLSGHGLEAVSDSVTLRSLFRGFMRENPDSADAMGRLNRFLEAELGADQFATALAATYDGLGGLSIVSAGHPHPVIIDNGKPRLVEVGGMALGVSPDTRYSPSPAHLPQGGVFVGYTDGLIEARIQGAEQFGEQRVMKAIVDMSDAGVRAIAEHLVDSALRHAGGRFADDVAVLVIRRRNHI